MEGAFFSYELCAHTTNGCHSVHLHPVVWALTLLVSVSSTYHHVIMGAKAIIIADWTMKAVKDDVISICDWGMNMAWYDAMAPTMPYDLMVAWELILWLFITTADH